MLVDFVGFGVTSPQRTIGWVVDIANREKSQPGVVCFRVGFSQLLEGDLECVVCEVCMIVYVQCGTSIFEWEWECVFLEYLHRLHGMINA